MKTFFWQGKPWQAFKTFAILFSFVMNLVLLLAGLLFLPILLPALNTLVTPLVQGLNQSFVDMGEASIVRTIEVKDQIPVQFTVPLSAETVVVLTESIPLQVPARFVFPANGGEIQGVVELDLPAQLELPVALNLDVPIDEQIPISLAVAVEIPLSETELGEPFADLQQLFSPLSNFFSHLPKDNDGLIDRFLIQSSVEQNSSSQNQLSK